MAEGPERGCLSPPPPAPGMSLLDIGCGSSRFGSQALEFGVATASELEEVAAGWRAFGAAAGGVFIAVSGEIIARA